MRGILESTLQDLPRQMRFTRAIWTREPEKKENTKARPHYSILQDDTKRERYLSSSSLPRSFYSGIRSNKHSPEADSRGEILEESSDVREWGGEGGIS